MVDFSKAIQDPVKSTITRSSKELETFRRMRISVAAYAYEFESTTIMSDAEYDSLADSLDLTIDTDRPDLDEFFREHYTPYSGMWIHKHPQLDGIKARYLLFYKKH